VQTPTPAPGVTPNIRPTCGRLPAMAVTKSESGAAVQGAVTAHRAPEQATPDPPGWLSRWARRDTVHAVAVVLIVIQIAWRADITSRGFLAVDDFVLVARAAESGLTADYLLYVFNDHLMPGGMLVTWLINKAFGLVYWPYVLLLTAGQAAVSITFYRLLRRLVRPGWGLLVPLCVFLFTPLTLELTAMWTTGIGVLPMQVAMVLAIGAQVQYVRTRRARHLITLALSFALGLVFLEKSLLIAPLILLMTACLFVSGGPLRSVVRALRRYWPSWLVLGTMSAAYLLLYMSRSQSSVRAPASPVEVVTFLQQLIGSTLVPGLFGGPWNWYDFGDVPPLVAPEDILRWLAWTALLLLVVVTVWLRRVATRAWVLLAVYLVLDAGLLAATRLGAFFSIAAGYAPRYVGDVVVVAALCIGIALLGQVDVPDEAHQRLRTLPAPLRAPGAITVGLVTALIATVTVGIGAMWTTTRFEDDWQVKQGRDYLNTAGAELAKAPAGTVFFDQTVPDGVVHSLFWPYNLQSHFFGQVDPRPVFVTEAENPSVFDETGHIRRLRVEGTSTLPGPDGDCGYRLADGRTVRMPLATTVFEWPWVVRVGYLSSGESTAVLRLGTATHSFQVHNGLNQIYFVMPGKGSAVELTINDPTVAVCSDGVRVGNAHPQQ
jgi:hypothetical protein